MKIVVLTGAGMSAESGVKTFRDAGGLWEGHRIEDVATPNAWQKNPQKVLDFYNERRRQLKKVYPNQGHILLAQLEKEHEVHIITQNVDNLHERAGSTKILHLHGELTKVRSELYPEPIFEWTEDLHIGDLCPRKTQLRPHIVWFGELVPEIETAITQVKNAELLIIVGTSLLVYPAASLYQYAPIDCPIYYIDPNPAHISDLNHHPVFILQKGASEGLSELYSMLCKN